MLLCCKDSPVLFAVLFRDFEVELLVERDRSRQIPDVQAGEVFSEVHRVSFGLHHFHFRFATRIDTPLTRAQPPGDAVERDPLSKDTEVIDPV